MLSMGNSATKHSHHAGRRSLRDSPVMAGPELRIRLCTHAMYAHTSTHRGRTRSPAHCRAQMQTKTKTCFPWRSLESLPGRLDPSPPQPTPKHHGTWRGGRPVERNDNAPRSHAGTPGARTKRARRSESRPPEIDGQGAATSATGSCDGAADKLGGGGAKSKGEAKISTLNTSGRN